MNLEQKYLNLIQKYAFEEFILSTNVDKMNTIIKKAIINFMETHTRVAIYGNGEHTSMLISDFSFELRDVKFIIDNYGKKEDISNGYIIIKEADLDSYEINGVILSSYYHQSAFRESMTSSHKNIDYLDIYSEIEKEGIQLNASYYDINHPHSRYEALIRIQDCLRSEDDYWELLKRYLQIKDFYSARKYAHELYEAFPSVGTKNFLNDVEDLIFCFHETIKKIAKNNVLMLCIDGLSREGLYGGGMPKLFNICQKKGCIFTNAYAYSTYTYESLLSAYSEDTNMRTEYHKKDSVRESDCRFISKAKQQERSIYFYTDGFTYITSEVIKLKENCRSVSEKLWEFVLDASGEDKGLFYIHVLYESHHPYRNPYIRGSIMNQGASVVYDLASQVDAKLHVDYAAQFAASLLYLDDQLSPLLSNLDCRVLLYADHGPFLVNRGTSLMEMRKTLLAADEERIRIPLVPFSPEMKGTCSDKLISLMEFNNIMLSLLEERKYHYPGRRYIKIGRSQIYGNVYVYICKQRGAEQEALAFEGFIFEQGYKLIIYANQVIKLYNLKDEELDDEELKNKLFKEVQEQITVF